jgi:aspartate/methionine/tyrosine aminotransferase
LLFNDEVFRLLELPPLQALPAACDLYENAVSVAGLSKVFGLGGLRIGWLVTKCQTVRQAIRQYRFNTSEATNTPGQWLACQVLEQPHDVLARNRSRIVENLSLLKQFVARHESWLRLHVPKAGTMAIVEQQTGLSSTEFCQRFLDQQRVLLIPGKPLGMPDHLLRFGLGRKSFSEGLDRLSSFLTKGKQGFTA